MQKLINTNKQTNHFELCCRGKKIARLCSKKLVRVLIKKKKTLDLGPAPERTTLSQ